jgi:glycosyltransferase involved in cell wall biosynthesis
VTVSIIVPAYNEEQLLPVALKAIHAASAAFTARGWPHEIIVCDNNSTDQTAAIALEHGAQVVFEPVNQIARARNAGAAAARGEWLLFIDADCSPSRALFEEAARLIASGRVLYAGAAVRLDRKLPLFESLLVSAWNLLSRFLRLMAGSFVMVEAAAFREVKGFNLDLYASEEIDLSLRLKALARRRGKRVTIIARAPLTTSARRVTFYRRADMVRWMLGAMLRPRATITSREACAMWYDGRR